MDSADSEDINDICRGDFHENYFSHQQSILLFQFYVYKIMYLISEENEQHKSV